MSTSRENDTFLVLKLLHEGDFKETAHMLERESQCYFDMRYLEEMVLSGNWDEAENYISGFTKIHENGFSTEIFFLIRKSKYIEALARKENAKALEILNQDLKVFKDGNENLFNEMALLLTYDDIRKHSSFSNNTYESARESVVQEMKSLIEANPLFKGKLTLRRRNIETGRAMSNSRVSVQSRNLVPAVCNDLPQTVARTLNLSSCPMSMDFHPIKQTFLLVGTSIGDIMLWDVSTGKRLLAKNFTDWNIRARSLQVEEALKKDSCASVKCILWSPDGTFFGVAYSKHIVQLCSYSGSGDFCLKVEIVYAHEGGINDLAFSSYENQPFLMTCGDDKTIKVWDADTGINRFTFSGHNAPVSSVCPTSTSQYCFSTSVDGKIKIWEYKTLSQLNFKAPGTGCTKMAFSADNKRLFLCGTNEGGKTFLVEWGQHKNSIRRTYHGLEASSSSVVQFDITRNQFLAAGHDHKIKIWDMDNVEPLITIDAEGGLAETPSICFNKEGKILAVVANENKIRILVTDCDHSADGSREITETVRKYKDEKDVEDVAVLVSPGVNNKEKVWKLFEITEIQCLFLPLYNRVGQDDHVEPDEISRLISINKGEVVALASNVHLLWKWPGNEATATVQFCLRKNFFPMINNVDGINREVAVPCIALNKTNSYLISSSGEFISLSNMLTKEVVTLKLPPPAAATCIAIHPQDDNIVAIGRDDSTIIIINFQRQEVLAMLEGHNKRVTGLDFSNTLNILISSGADTQIFSWSSEEWIKEKCTFLQVPGRKKLESLSDTHIQFHQNQLHFLAVHKNFLAIYEADTLKCVKWVQGLLYGPISSATFSADCCMVYTSFQNGMIIIFDTLELRPHCRISPNAYLPSHLSYPLVIAAHPQIPTQFAVGLSTGEVRVIRPLNFVDSDVTDSTVE